MFCKVKINALWIQVNRWFQVCLALNFNSNDKVENPSYALYNKLYNSPPQNIQYTVQAQQSNIVNEVTFKRLLFRSKLIYWK